VSGTLSKLFFVIRKTLPVDGAAAGAADCWADAAAPEEEAPPSGARRTGTPGTVRSGVEMLSDESCDSASEQFPPKHASFSSMMTVRSEGLIDVRSNSMRE
jgi:hypothetical protein